jgi:hypothetical protein
LTTVLRFDRYNPAALFQSGDRAVKSPGSEADIGETPDVLHHGVSMLFAVGERGKNEKSRFGHSYYALRSIVRRNRIDVKR